MIEARVEGRTRITTFRDVVDSAELREHVDRLTTAPDFDPTLNSLVDLRELSDPRFDSADVGDIDRQFHRAVPDDARRRMAFVVGTPIMYGYARAFENQHADARDEIRIFEDIEAAREWLGLPRNGRDD